MINKKINFLVGLVVLVALLILLFGIHFLKDTVSGEKMDKYYVVFDKVSTLALGDPVKFNGVTMGRVKTIELWENKVRVRFDIKQAFKGEDGKEYPVKIPKDSRIIVQNIGLMGERQIEIGLGDSREYYEPGDIIQNGLFDAGIAEAVGIAGKVFEEAEMLMLAIRQVVDSTIGQKDFVPVFKNIMNETKYLTEKIRVMIDVIDPKIKTSINNLESASKEIESLLNAQDGPIHMAVKNGLTITEDAKRLMGKVETITDEMNKVMKKINSQEGTLGAMIYDSLFYRELRGTIREADSLLYQIRKQGLDVNIDFF